MPVLFSAVLCLVLAVSHLSDSFFALCRVQACAFLCGYDHTFCNKATMLKSTTSMLTALQQRSKVVEIEKNPLAVENA